MVRHTTPRSSNERGLIVRQSDGQKIALRQARIAHYQHRAAEVRAKAATASGARRVELLKLAEHFEELADRITMNRRA